MQGVAEFGVRLWKEWDWWLVGNTRRRGFSWARMEFKRSRFLLSQARTAVEWNGFKDSWHMLPGSRQDPCPCAVLFKLQPNRVKPRVRPMNFLVGGWWRSTSSSIRVRQPNPRVVGVAMLVS